MRLIDADELMKQVYRESPDGRERIAEMIADAPTCIDQNNTAKMIEELKAHVEYLRRQNDSMKGEIKALSFAVRCNGISGNEVLYAAD